MNAAMEAIFVTRIRTVPTLLALIIVAVQKDTLEAANHVKVYHIADCYFLRPGNE